MPSSSVCPSDLMKFELLESLVEKSCNKLRQNTNESSLCSLGDEKEKKMSSTKRKFFDSAL